MASYTAGERTLLSRAVATLVIGLMLCGCSDAPHATSDEVAKPASTSEPDAVPKRPSTAITKLQEFDGPHDVIVEGRLTVDIMQIVGPPRLIEFGQRIQQAVRANPDWWLQQVENRTLGEPLPYDPRLGLSKAEYDEFLAMKMATQKKAEATLVVTKKEDNVYVFDGGRALPDFTGIEIDLKNDVVRTPFGVLTERSEIDASKDSALGAWVGTQWKTEKLDVNGITGTVAKLAVGKLKPSDRGVIYYDVKNVSLDGKIRISHVLNYDLPERD
jgi:hypothetical protein